MFLNRLYTKNTYALSAASAYESSYGTYCGSSAIIDGTYINSCLGDEFSCNWMEDIEEFGTYYPTLYDNFYNTRTNTKYS